MRYVILLLLISCMQISRMPASSKPISGAVDTLMQIAQLDPGLAVWAYNEIKRQDPDLQNYAKNAIKFTPSQLAEIVQAEKEATDFEIQNKLPGPVMPPLKQVRGLPQTRDEALTVVTDAPEIKNIIADYLGGQSFQEKLDHALKEVTHVPEIKNIIAEYVGCNIPDYKFHQMQAFDEPFINAAALSPDGKYIATYSGEPHQRYLRIRDGETLAVLKEWTHPRLTGSAKNLQFSPDGKQLLLDLGEWQCDDEAPGIPNVLRIFNTATLELIKELKIKLDAADQQRVVVAYSPDSKLLAVDDGFYLRLFDTRNYTIKKNKLTRDTYVSSLAFSPDGKTIAVLNLGGHAVDRSIALLDSETLKELDAHISPDILVVDRLLFSPTGNYLVALGSFAKESKIKDARHMYHTVGDQDTATRKHKFVVWKRDGLRRVGEVTLDSGKDINRVDFAFVPHSDILIYRDNSIKFLCLENKKQEGGILYTYTNYETTPFNVRFIAVEDKLLALSYVPNSNKVQLLKLSTS